MQSMIIRLNAAIPCDFLSVVVQLVYIPSDLSSGVAIDHISLSIILNILGGGLIKEILLVENTMYVDVPTVKLRRQPEFTSVTTVCFEPYILV